jgi:hypothetical protein
MNEVVGSSAVGYGFNALGEFGPSSLLSRAFLKTFALNKTYTYPVTGIEYAVPDNVDVNPFTPLSGGTQVFNSQYDLQEYLALSGEISVSYGAFSGEVKASYSGATQEWGSIFYALTNVWVGLWTTSLSNSDDPSLLDPTFKSVLDGLPPTFNSTTVNDYFSFFQQYGTHFVKSVGAGGYFCYYEGVQNSGSMSVTQVTASCELEYNAVFLDVGGKAAADWSSLGQQWVNSRVVTISVLGGAASSLSSITPVYGTNDPSSYSNWLGSIESNPSTMNFVLREWTDVLPVGSDRQAAMRHALVAYLNYGIYLSVAYDGSVGLPALVVNGQTTVPVKSWPANPQSTAQGIELAIVDNNDELTVTFSAVYYLNFDGSNAKDMYNQIMQDLAAYPNIQNQWGAIAIFNCPWGVTPDARLLAWLGNFGIGSETWTDNYYNCGGGQASFSYIALGLNESQGDFEAVALNQTGSASTISVDVNPFLQGLTAQRKK